jgi:ribose transport system substrate-binding protein
VSSSRMRHGVAGLAAVVVLSVLLAACGSGGSDTSASSGSSPASSETTAAETGSPQTIKAFVFAPRGFNGVTKSWWNGMEQGASALGSGFHVEILAPDKLTTDPGEYLNFVNQAIVDQPEGIVVVPNVAEAMKSGLERIAASGVKVLIMDQDVVGMKGKVSFVGTNNEKAGAQAAEWLLEQKLPSDEIAILASTPGTTSTDDRLAGFEGAIAGSDLKVVALKKFECGESTEARTVMADILTANPNLGGVYSVCDIHALGAAQALQAANKLDVQQVSIDASEEGVEAIINEAGIDAEVAQRLVKVGKTSVETLGKALEGESVPPSIDTGSELVTASNAKAFLAKSKAEQE